MNKQILKCAGSCLLVLMSCKSSPGDKEKTGVDVNSPQEEMLDGAGTGELTLLEQGKNFAMQTQKVLAVNLINEIKTRGTEHALTFCSVKAYPLTDSMAIALNAQIKRVSDKERNPDNKANQVELAYIAKSKEILAGGGEIQPQMTEINGKMVGYYPIITNGMCMQCHGNQESEVLPATLLQLKKLYPADKAINYKINELRGIWVVEMDKK